MIRCQHCQYTETEVRDSRPCHDFGGTQRRRRKCVNCNKVFKTIEIQEGIFQQIKAQYSGIMALRESLQELTALHLTDNVEDV